MWKKKEEKKEEKEEDLLKKLCGNDTKLYDLLSQSLYLDPKEAISKPDLKILVEEAEKSAGDEDYRGAMEKYRTALDKAIFEATQNPGEMGRYIKVSQDLASKTAKVIEKAKEKARKEGFASPSLEGRIKYYESMSERIEDVIRIASLFYNERLEELGASARALERETRKGERRGAERKEEKDEMEAKERREARRKGMGRGERKEAEREDEEIEKKDEERGKARRKEGIEAEREEDRAEEREKERREAKRKEREKQE
ncbi:MAG: hypothetical protein ABSD73_02480 [Candidatus Bathyarchaeia archaeon]|jgi:trichohyalin